ncbi:TfuA-like protein [Streptomyces collinus]|uniref:TfuA-like protein n=1 Tax=Streptomyces collinus TaxID=42684 RepID=UPI003332DDCF
MVIDGEYHQAPALQHKRILAAMDRGVGVIGAASFGALAPPSGTRLGWSASASSTPPRLAGRSPVTTRSRWARPRTATTCNARGAWSTLVTASQESPVGLPFWR